MTSPLPPGAAAELQLLTITQTMALLQVSRSTLQRAVKAGKLQVIGDGSLTRIPLASIRAYQQRYLRGSDHATR